MAEKPDGPNGEAEPARSEKRAEEIRVDRELLERMYGVRRDCCGTETSSSSRHFSPGDQARAVQVAAAHPAVAAGNGSWTVLGAAQFWARRSASPARQVVDVHLFDYAANRMIAVRVEDDRVASVEDRGVHEHPESPREIVNAIATARMHPDLAERVRGLQGHAILRVPEEPEPFAGHRCMWVMFTERDDPARQMPTLYTALVDLTTLEVVVNGATPCGQRILDQGTVGS